MSYISDHLAEAFNRIISQYRFNVKIGRNPMELEPTAAFATMRLEGCKSTFIMRLHRNSDDVLIDVYEFRRNGNAYKTTADGAWVDMTGDTYFVDTWYNQSVPGSDLTQSDKAKKPTLVTNQRNGFPVARWDGTDDWLLSDKSTNEFITPSEGVMIAGFNPTGDALPVVSIPNPYLCQAIIADYDAFAPLTRGICTPYGPNDSVFADMYSTTEYAVPMEVLAGNWYNVVWKLYNGILYGYKNGALAGTENAGVISSDLSSVLVMGHYPWHGTRYLEGDTDQVYTFDENVSEQDIYDIHLFMKNGGDTDINKIKKIIKCLVEQVQDIEDAMEPFFDRLNIASQSGAQLDGIGDIIGQAREFFTDDIYKQLLYLKIIRNISEGTPEELIEIFSTMTGAEIVQYIEQYPAAFTLTAINPDYLFDYPYIWEAIQKAKPAGVGINGLIEAVEPVFAFLDDTVGDTDGFADVVPPATPTVGGIFASLMPTDMQQPINPLLLSPKIAYATFRLEGCLSTYIMRVRRGSDNADIDIWDVNRYTSEYKTSESGSWIDASTDTWFVDTLYNQLGTGNDAKQQGNDSWQPELVFNARNGYPTIKFDGTDDRLIGVNLSGWIGTDLYTATAMYKPTGTSPTQPEYWQLPCIIGEECYWQMSRGILTAESDKIWFGHWDTGANKLGIDYTIGEWAGWAQRFSSGELAGIKNGTEKVTAAEGNLPGLCNLAIGETNGDVLEGEVNHIYLFDVKVSDNDIARIYSFCKQN